MGLGGVLVFAAVVLALHGLQPDFNARRQLISELAVGAHGWAMLPAFTALAAALAGVALGLRVLGASAVPTGMLGAAAVGMLAAGLFRLDRAAGTHIAAVGLAFALIALAMYLLPARAGRLGSRSLRAVSWLLGAGAAASLAAASCGLPVGIAQRLAAACVLGWLAVLSWALVRSQAPQPMS